MGAPKPCRLWGHLSYGETHPMGPLNPGESRAAGGLEELGATGQDAARQPVPLSVPAQPCSAVTPALAPAWCLGLSQQQRLSKQRPW